MATTIKFECLPTNTLRITSGFGPRDFAGYAYHNGVDLGREVIDEPIKAVNSGAIKVAKNSVSYGNYIVIEHNGYCTLYAHLKALNANVGDKVNAGQVIGIMGTTGQSTGVHLHFEVRQCKYGSVFWQKSASIKDKAVYCADPTPYLQEVIAPKVHWAQAYLDELQKAGIISNPDQWEDFNEYPTKAQVLALMCKIYKACK